MGAPAGLLPSVDGGGCLTFKFKPSELQPLRAAIGSDPLHRSDAHEIAVHDG